MKRFGASCRSSQYDRAEPYVLTGEFRAYKLSHLEQFVSSSFPHDNVELPFLSDDVDPYIVCMAMEQQIH